MPIDVLTDPLLPEVPAATSATKSAPETDDIQAALDLLKEDPNAAMPPLRTKVTVHVPITRKSPLRTETDSDDGWFDNIVLPEERQIDPSMEALLANQHRKAMERAPRTVDAFRAVLMTIQQRTTAANAPATPFTSRDVNSLSAALEEKLPMLVLARRLEQIYANNSSGLELFDHPVRPTPARDNRHEAVLYHASRAQAARFAAIAVLLRPVLESVSAILVTRSPQELFAQVATVLSLGIETGRWQQLHPNLKDIAELLHAATNNVAPLLGTLDQGRLLRLAAIRQAQFLMGLRE